MTASVESLRKIMNDLRQARLHFRYPRKVPLFSKRNICVWLRFAKMQLCKPQNFSNWWELEISESCCYWISKINFLSASCGQTKSCFKSLGTVMTNMSINLQTHPSIFLTSSQQWRMGVGPFMSFIASIHSESVVTNEYLQGLR